MPTRLTHTRPRALAVWLIVAGTIGLIAAFALTVEKIHVLENPGAKASCDFSIVIQCGANLASDQGSVFGFPNPIIGLVGWMAPLVIGFAILAGATFARWFWLGLWAGVTFAVGFVLWLISQSIFELFTLCPWCMVTWVVTFPTFYAVTLHILRSGVLPAPRAVRGAAERLMSWVPLMAFVTYVVIAVIAQVQLDWMQYL